MLRELQDLMVFSFLFHQEFWPIIKMDYMALVRSFEKEISIARLNYALITQISKEEEAKTLNKFMPISLINCNFKKKIIRFVIGF
jgi:hypothetical protein